MIWFANLSSLIGQSIQMVGAAWLMTTLTQSNTLIAAVQVSASVPIMFFSILAGAITDNFERRRVMLVAQIAMLAAASLLAVLNIAQLITPALLLLLTFCIGAGSALNAPAWQASVRQQVSGAEVPQAVALNIIGFNAARTIGPAVGGIVVSNWSSSAAFIINAVCVALMIQILLSWKPEGPKAVYRPMLPAIGIGIRFCAADREIRNILLRGFVLGIGIGGFQALMPAFARDSLHGGGADFGLMLGLFGVGSVAGALFVTPAQRRWGTEAVWVMGSIVTAAGISTLGMAQSLTLALVAAGLAGAGWVIASSCINIAMQLRSPEAILGRCLSIFGTSVFGGMALGAWLCGAVADAQDLPFALHGAATFTLASLVVMRVIVPISEPQELR